MKNLLKLMGIAQIVLAVGIVGVNIFYIIKDDSILDKLKAGGSEAVSIIVALAVVFLIRVIGGLLAAVGNGKHRVAVIVLGILMLLQALPNSKMLPGMVPFSIVAVVVSVIYLIAAFGSKKVDSVED